ncbi:uncharacterized protein TNCV_2310471 [Trichonephila clavipes]|nr:uncharacterized protein TNCV_2310471 [Trichonephila clavipes]
MKTVTYKPQANLTERVNRNLVQMTACFVKESHENWDRFLHEFAFALRTSVNETTNKTLAELILGRKIITPFSKLINVTEGNRVNIDQVSVYRPRQSETISSDSHVKTLYEGQRSSDKSSRSQLGKFKGSRKNSSEQNNGHKSSKGNAEWEDPRLKRKVDSNGSGDGKNIKGIKKAIPSSVSSRNHKYKRPNNHSQRSQPIAGPSHQQDSRQDKSPTVASRHEGSGQYSKTRETKTTKDGTNWAAERRTVRSKQTTAVRPCPYYLRSRVRQPEGFPEERRNSGLASIPQNNIRRRNLSMEALDGDPVDRSE